MSLTPAFAAPSVNVLLVDDRPANLLALQATLKNDNLRIVCVHSGAQAIQAVQEDRFALILLDVSMPEMDGFETARRIRDVPSAGQTPIIFVTASMYDTEHVQRGYAVGAVDYLYKPLMPDIVRAKVGVFVQIFRQREQIRRQAELLAISGQRERARLMEHAEAALSASEAQYDATARQAPFGVAVLRPDGSWLRANPRLCAMVGYSTATLPPLLSLLCPEDVPAEVTLESLVLGRASAQPSEVRLLHRSGKYIWASMALSRLSETEHSHLALVLEDISERKWVELCQRFLNQASKVLLSSMEYQDTLVQAAQLAVPFFADGCAIDVLNGDDTQTEELVLLHRHPHRVAALRRGRHEAMAATAALGKGPGNPTDSWLHVPMVAHGRVLGAVTFVCDAEQRSYSAADRRTAEDFANRCALAVDNARLYEEAQAAGQARDEFLSVASHELRTPLTPLRIQLQRLIGTPHRPPANFSPERIRDILQRSEGHVQRLAALIDTLLDVTRITAGRLTLDLDIVDLAEVTREAVGRLGEELAAAGSHLTLDADVATMGRWDRSRLDQVVTNLLTNAIKYGRGNPIEVAVKLCDGSAYLAVRDHGIGIDAAKLGQIFERFERAVPTHAYGGLGLGLFIARQIIEAHGGCIRVSSEPQGGSLFTVELPMEVALLREPYRSVNGRDEESHPPPA